MSSTCNGKASILVLDLSTAFDTVDHQLLLGDFYDCGVKALHCLCLNLTLKTGNNALL